jgi:hypothetical protein
MALLQREHDAASPSDEARSRVRDRVHASVGLAATTVAGVSLAVLRSSGKMMAVGKSSFFAGATIKLALGLVVGGLGATAYLAWHAHAHQAAPVHVAPLADRTAGHAVPPAPVPAPAAAVIPVTPDPTTAPRHHLSDDESHLNEERALLEKARHLVNVGDTAGALAAVEHHAHRFPSGQLAEERECLRIRALVSSGNAEGAKQVAAAFAQRYPDSLFQASGCASP